MLQTCDLTATHAAVDMCNWSALPERGNPGWLEERNGKSRTVGLRDAGGCRGQGLRWGDWEPRSHASMISLLSRGGERGVAAACGLITSSNNKCSACNGRKTEGGRVSGRNWVYLRNTRELLQINEVTRGELQTSSQLEHFLHCFHGGLILTAGGGNNMKLHWEKSRQKEEMWSDCEWWRLEVKLARKPKDIRKEISGEWSNYQYLYLIYILLLYSSCMFKRHYDTQSKYLIKDFGSS